MKKISIFLMMATVAVATFAQQFDENDRKMFNEGQVLTEGDLQITDDVIWDSQNPKQVFSLHNEDGETILTMSHSVYFDSQWVTFSKGLVIADSETGDTYHVRDYAIDGLTMDKLLIVKGCNKKNVLIPLRFPKLKRKVKYINVYSYDHKDDLKPSNRAAGRKCLGEWLSVKKLRNRHQGIKVYR